MPNAHAPYWKIKKGPQKLASLKNHPLIESIRAICGTRVTNMNLKKKRCYLYSQFLL